MPIHLQGNNGVMPVYPILRTTRRQMDYAVDLRAVRRWFDEVQGGDPPQQTPDPSSGQSDAGGMPDQKWPDLPSDVREHIQELEKKAATANNEAARRRVELDEVRQQLATLSAAQKKQLADDGKFKELAEQAQAEIAQLQVYKEQAEKLEKRFQESNAARIKQIPEAMHGFVPTEYSPEQLAGWLDKNWAMLTQRTAPNLDAGAGGGSGVSKKLPPLTDYEKQIAKASGMSETEYAEFKAKGQPTTLEDLQKG